MVTTRPTIHITTHPTRPTIGVGVDLHGGAGTQVGGAAGVAGHFLDSRVLDSHSSLMAIIITTTTITITMVTFTIMIISIMTGIMASTIHTVTSYTTDRTATHLPDITVEQHSPIRATEHLHGTPMEHSPVVLTGSLLAVPMEQLLVDLMEQWLLPAMEHSRARAGAGQ